MNGRLFSPWLLGSITLMFAHSAIADKASDLLALTGGREVKCVYYQENIKRIKCFSTSEGVERDLLGVDITAKVSDVGPIKIDKSGTLPSHRK